MKKEVTQQARDERNAYMREWRARKKQEKSAKLNAPHSVRRKIIAHAVAGKLVENPSMGVSTALREVGASEHAIHNPQVITQSKEWAEILDEYLPRAELGEVHRGLLRASRIDHLVFTRDGEPTDEEIIVMLKDINCMVRKIVHGEQARHVYFFAPDNRARKDALEMAYKLRGDFAGDKAQVAFSLAALAGVRDKGQGAESALPSTADNGRPQLPRAVDAED